MTRQFYKLIIFDMDGTLTEELLDFPAIRRDLGMPEKGGILEHIAHLEGAARSEAEAILHRHEMQAATRCILHPGAHEVLVDLRKRGKKTALLTRNSAPCAGEILTRHNLKLDYVATRDNPPHKPHPDAILNITRHFRIDPREALMVGDYLYDLQTAAAAGTDSALLCKKEAPRPDFASMATYCIESLLDLLPLV